MLNLDDLYLFVQFYKEGTLTKVSQQEHLSQPSLTRAMKRVEESLSVTLFNRSANKLELNEVGIRAAIEAENLLSQAEKMKQEIITYDRSLKTLTILSCAPAPLWLLTEKLANKYHDKTVSYNLIDDLNIIEQQFNDKTCSICILPYPINKKGVKSIQFVEENLSICLPKDHQLAKYNSLTASQINGYNCLLGANIGFWKDYHLKNYPNSRFLVQTDEFAFNELIVKSSLPFFTTNLATRTLPSLDDRVTIPITDEDANITFYLNSWQDIL